MDSIRRARPHMDPAGGPSEARAQQLAAVLEIITQVTLGEAEGFGAHSQLSADLGVESIDLLDILFKIEDAFGISLGSPPPPFLDGGFFEPEAGNLSGGRLTDAGRRALAGVPGLDAARLAGDGAAAYLGSVGALVDLVGGHLSRGAPPGRSP